MVIHLNKATCDTGHAVAFWCGDWSTTEPSVQHPYEAKGAADCPRCLRAALRGARRLRDHYLNEMIAARSGLQTERERAWTARRAALVEEAKETQEALAERARREGSV